MKLIFLHGVGDGSPKLEWRDLLNERLGEVGIAPIPLSDIIAPHYADMLSTSGFSADMPKVTVRKTSVGVEARAQFQTRQIAALRAVGRDPNAQVMGFGGVLDAGNPSWVSGVAKLAPGASKQLVQQVNQYANSPGLRAAVVRKVLSELPRSGEVVIVGHSLGSVVAIDVITRLSPDVNVKRLITIGSPVSSKIFGQNSSQLIANFPYGAVGDWMNFFSPRDPITRGCGLSTAFSDVRDVRVNIGKSAHSASRYIANATVARAIGSAFHPAAPDKRRTTRVTTAITDETASKVLETHYNYAVEAALSKNAKARFAEAVRIRREDLVGQIWEANAEGMPLPREFHQLAEGHLPDLPDYWTTSQIVEELTILVLSNSVAPFEIEVDRKVKLKAAQEILDGLGRDAKIGDHIDQSIGKVMSCLKKDGFRWGQVAAVGAGLAIVALGPISLAAVAPAGLAGGAALTSSLALLGPGGMVGGIATVSGIASTGAAVTTAAAVRKRAPGSIDVGSYVARVVAAYAQSRLALDYDEGLPEELSEVQTDLTAEINQLSGISDKKAPSIEAAEGRAEVIRRLAEFLKENGLSESDLG